LRDRQFSNPIFVEGQPVPEGKEPIVQYSGITSGYFRAMGIPLLKGRDFSEREMWETGGVVIINTAMARQLWTNQDPLGKRIKHGTQQNWLTVIGVVGDVRQRRLDLEPYPQIYVPYADYQHTTMTLAVRAASNPTGLVAAVRREASGLDPSLPVFNVMTINQALTQSTADKRLTMTLLSLFAALAMALATVGIYGVLSYMVTQRTHEIGVRMALGAQQGDVVKLVVGQGMRLVLVGLSVGWLAALFLARLMSSLLFGVTPSDPGIFLVVTMLLFIVTLSACYIPARRASKIDPIVAVRHS
jgi:putative ABC transport system permease protein